MSSILNIALDIWFVVGLKLGVGGAALATVLAQAVSEIGIMIYSLVKLPVLRFGKEDIRWNRGRMKEIIINDVSTGVQQSVMNFGILMIQGLVNSFGASVMASFAAAVKTDTIAYMPAQEFIPQIAIVLPCPECCRRETAYADFSSHLRDKVAQK